MASLPTNRTKLQTAINNQVAGTTADAGANIAAIIELYDSADLMNQKVDGLVAAGTLATTPPVNMSRQALINGNFDIAQRGTSFSNPANGAYVEDRWLVGYGVDGGTLPSITHNRAQLSPGDISGSYYCSDLSVIGAGSGFGINAYYSKSQRIENGTRLLCGQGKKVTVSFYARSFVSGKKIGVGLRQYYGSGGSPSAQEFIPATGQIITLTSTWTRYTVTFTTNTLAGKTFGTNNDDYLQLSFYYMWGSSIGSSWFNSATTEGFGGTGSTQIAQVQVNSGDVAYPFQPKSFADELQACMRYYEKSYDYSVAPGSNSSAGAIIDTMPAIANAYVPFSYKVRKRAIPNISIYDTNGNANRIFANGTFNQTYLLLERSGECGAELTTNAISASSPVIFHFTADAEL